MPPDTRLAEIATNILDVMATELTARGIDVPTRRFRQHGDIAHDFAGQKCSEAFVITFDGLFQGVVDAGGNLTNAPIRCAMPLVAQFTLVLLRCVPVVKTNGKAPSAEEEDASAEVRLLDSMTMADVAIVAQTGDGLTGLECSLVGIGQVTSYGPLGGVGGTIMTFQVSLI